MSNEVSIFKSRDVAVTGKKAPSALTQSLMKGGLKRISPRNGMFVRVVNGDAAGKFKAPLRVVIVGVAPDVQRTFYVKAYDPNAMLRAQAKVKHVHVASSVAWQSSCQKR